MSVERPPWSFEDLGLMLGAVLPSLLLALLVVRAGRAAAPRAFTSDAVSTVVYQCVFYAVLLAALYLLTFVRYRQPFWRALGWTFDFRRAWLCVLVAPVLAIALSALGVLLRTPPIINPIEDLLGSGVSQVAMMLFIAVLGPFWEESMFRGFLYPLLERALGPWPGILLSGAAFALIHGVQNQWLWQPLLIIGLAGAVFGYARYKTRSTAAAALLHMGYNTTLLAGFLAQRG
jgi:membrane protease YdiL (CAAX protease family)